MSVRTLPVNGVYCGASHTGHGLFAGRRFAAGEPVFTLKGELMSLAEVLAKGDAAANAFQMDQDVYLYPTTLEGRFVNHSCNPNAGLRADRDMIALRDIEAAGEIRFDYSTCMSERLWTMRCRCGEANCRGIVRDFHDLPAEIRRRYLAAGIVQRFILREISDAAARRNGSHEPAARSPTPRTPGPGSSDVESLPSQESKPVARRREPHSTGALSPT